MGKPDTEDILIDAAFELMAEKGYLGATTREIAARAGVTELTLFRRFKSKEKLFERVLMRCGFDEAFEDMMPGLKALPYDRALYAIALKFYGHLRKRKSIIMVMMAERRHFPKRIQKLHRQLIENMIATLSEYFKDAAKQGAIRKVDVVIVTRALLGMVFSFFHSEEIIKGGVVGKRELEAMLKGMTDIVARGTLK